MVTLPQLTTLVFVLHIGGGTIGLISGTVAAIAAKGGRLHRAAGNIFFWSMLFMAVCAVYLGFARPGQIVNVFIGIFALYLITTGWLTARRPATNTPTQNRLTLLVSVLLCLPFVVLSVQLAAGLPPFFKSAVPLKGPVLVAIYGFTSVLFIGALGDAKVMLAGAIAGAPRIARHLWRMCLGLTLAAGSAFTNGLPRLMPGPFSVPWYFFLPQFLPLVLLIVWMLRVRLTGWRQSETSAQPI